MDPAGGALEELQRVIDQIRQKWKNVEILVRGDSAYARENIMAWCELQTEVDFVFGLAQNSRLIKMTTVIQSKAKLEFEQKLTTFVLSKSNFEMLNFMNRTFRLQYKEKHSYYFIYMDTGLY